MTSLPCDEALDCSPAPTDRRVLPYEHQIYEGSGDLLIGPDRTFTMRCDHGTYVSLRSFTGAVCSYREEER